MFPEITTWSNNLAALVHALGLGLFVVVMGIVGMIFMTSFGSERRNMLAKTAAIMAAIGLGFIIAAGAIQAIISRILGG
ncbi:hypothetical protein [Thermogemmatispora sp.]|uniref:hypothetical protein n=1 Tax=Thermogemmatispora sp. TaxID=1968838 RepID=UPI0035E413AD